MSANLIALATSGGIGSTTAAFRVNVPESVQPIWVAYGQTSADHEWRAVTDLSAARKWKTPVRLELAHVAGLADVGMRFERNRSGGAFSGLDILDEGSAFILPELLFAVAHWAFRKGISRVLCGLSRHGSTNSVNPDHLVPWHHDVHGFVHSINLALAMTVPASCRVELEAPMADLSAGDVRRLAGRLRVPLSLTRSCLSDGAHPCGRCSGCLRNAVTVEPEAVEAGLRA